MGVSLSHTTVTGEVTALSLCDQSRQRVIDSARQFGEECDLIAEPLPGENHTDVALGGADGLR